MWINLLIWSSEVQKLDFKRFQFKWVQTFVHMWYMCVIHVCDTFVGYICAPLIFQLFVLEVVANSTRLSDDNIYCQLKRCVQMAEEGEKNAEALGILTAAPRNTWAAARLRLLEGERCYCDFYLYLLYIMLAGLAGVVYNIILDAWWVFMNRQGL